MDVKTLQQALNGAIQLDINRAKEKLGMSLDEHAEAFLALAPNVARALVLIGKFGVVKGKFGVVKLEAEAN